LEREGVSARTILEEIGCPSENKSFSELFLAVPEGPADQKSKEA